MLQIRTIRPDGTFAPLCRTDCNGTRRPMEFRTIDDALSFGLHNCGLIYDHKGLHPRTGRIERVAYIEFWDAETNKWFSDALLMGNGYRANEPPED